MTRSVSYRKNIMGECVVRGQAMTAMGTATRCTEDDGVYASFLSTETRPRWRDRCRAWDRAQELEYSDRERESRSPSQSCAYIRRQGGAERISRETARQRIESATCDLSGADCAMETYYWAVPSCPLLAPSCCADASSLVARPCSRRKNGRFAKPLQYLHACLVHSSAEQSTGGAANECLV